jgi:phosphoglycolate phosphatase-like HAD superfamily hydrolase
MAKVKIGKKVVFKSKVLLLDLDDTLVSTMETAYAKTCLVAQKLELHVPDPTAFVQAYKPLAFPHYLAAVLGKKHNLLKLLEIFEQVHEQVGGYQLHDGVQELLEQAKQADMPRHIITNASGERVPAKLDKIADYFDGVWHADNNVKKPDIRCVLPIFKQHREINFSDLLLIGDSLVDWQTAKNLSIGFIAVTTGAHLESDFLEKDPEAIIVPNLTAITITK